MGMPEIKHEQAMRASIAMERCKTKIDRQVIPSIHLQQVFFHVTSVNNNLY